ncbi:acyl-CoA/acyl-ACP dehydrogenase [Acuticoccus sp. M5D2P5]|uniref:acyl-CoA dehydrogenase family protein n=1 Tax=Acuticoccus kalidii TaxID=2910977 RepID=UPI001F355323|nr:acyl-CoA dehydrogenase family protein [Acuticoccus kalidii]MCF3933849.1 acyl-CoA/acyl-ACP dehydrogenase [Acuticoccus kalidii]
MDFDFTEEQTLALESWNRLLERDVAPKVAPFRDTFIDKAAARELLAITGEYGVGTGWVPEEDGGIGLDFVTSGLLYEALARVSPDLAGLAFVNEGAALKIQRLGTPEQKEKYLPGLLAGELIGCSAISEPGAGSDVPSMSARAEKDGDVYRLYGEKQWISNASLADLVVTVVRTGEKEFSMFLLDREKHAFSVREVDKLGLNGWSLGQIFLDGVTVTDADRLGPAGEGLRESMKGFERSRCFISLVALGISRAAIDDAIAYAAERKAFGKPIAGHQLVQDMVAEMATLHDASQLLVYRALSLLDKGGKHNCEAAIAKSFTTESVQRITSLAIQVYGAAGIARENGVERHFRNARMLTIPDGTTQINRLVIGRELLGVNAFR